MGITIKEIARLTGTSTTAVSFVLNGKAHGSVGAAKRALILQTIKKYGYKQNNLARGLQARRTYRVAICVRGFFDAYPLLGNFSTYDAIGRMMRRFSERGYSTEWLQIEAGASTRDTVKALSAAPVDGLVFAKWGAEEMKPLLPALRKRKLHAVCLNTLVDSPAVSSCGYSLEQAAFAGTQYLMAAGRRQIALLDFLAGDAHIQHRAGYLRALAGCGQAPIIHEESPGRRVDNVARITRAFIAAHPAVDGIVSTENLYSLFVSQVIGERDIRLVSIGDTTFAQMQRPTMAHLSLPMRAMADWCAETLLARIEAREALPARHQEFACELQDG